MIRTYNCQNCGYEFEKTEKMGAAAKKKCPKCKKYQLLRKVEASNIHFTGPGFSRKLG